MSSTQKDYKGIINSVYENLISEAIGVGGLGKLSKRKKHWLIINNVSSKEIGDFKKKFSKKKLDATRDSNVVYNDSNRYNHNLISDFDDHSLNSNSDNSDEGVSVYRKDLFADQLYLFVTKVLYRNSRLHYYQGFHDIASVFLLVLGPSKGAALLNKLANRQLRDFMSYDVNRTFKYLELTMVLIQVHDYQLYKFLRSSEVGNIFCLSWIITWFSHNVNSFSIVSRIFDFLMVTNKFMPVYLSASLVMGFREEILLLENDIVTIHSFLSSIPACLDAEEWEKAIESSVSLFDSFNSDTLLSYSSSFLVYKSYVTLSRYFTRKRHPPGFKKSLINKNYVRNGFTITSKNNYSYYLKLSAPIVIIAVSVSFAFHYFINKFL